MSKRRVLVVASLSVFSAAASAQGRVPLRVSDYLMDRDAEIALARSAGPGSVSDSATVWVLGSNGFVTVVSGTNGYVCYVARSMSGSPLDAEGRPSRGFRDPAIRAPHCMNAEAARSIGAWHALITGLALQGLEEAAIDSAVRVSMRRGELSPPAHFATAFMWSVKQHLGSSVGHWKPHMMFYHPYLTQAAVGKTEFLGDGPQVLEGGTPWAVLVVPMRQFTGAGTGTLN